MLGRTKVYHIDLDDIGKWVKAARKDLGLNQEELAEIVGMHQISVSNIETGKTIPSWQTIEAFATVFNCDFKIAMMEKIEPTRNWVKGGIGRYK